MTIHRTRLLLAGVSLLGFALVDTAPAMAQGPTTGPTPAQEAAGESGIADIVVTARGFEERLQDIPITVSTLSGEDLARQGIDDLSDIAEKTVGFAYEGFTGPLAQPTIRGQTNLRTQSPVLNVASYLDGIYLQRGYLIDQSLIELERVDIIKGPQSSLYGRNSFAGVINITSRRPDLNDFTGKVSGTIGTDERYDWKGTISVPLIPGKLAILGSYAHSEFDGTWKNAHPLANAKGANAFTRGNVGGYEKEAYQIRALAELGDFTFDAQYIHTKRNIEQVPTISVGTSSSLYPFNTLNCSLKTLPGSAFAAATTENRLFCGELQPVATLAPGETRPSTSVIADPRSFGQRGPTDFASAKLEVAPSGPFSAFAQFGYTSAKIDVRGNASRDPTRPNSTAGLVGVAAGTTNFDSSSTGSSFKSYAGEARVTYATDPLRLFVGVNYTRTNDLQSDASETGPINSLALPFTAIELFPVGPGLAFPANSLQRRTFFKRNEDIWSFYGFAEIKPGEKFALSLEGRFTIEDQEAVDFLTRQPGNTTIQALIPPRGKRTEHYFTPRVSATYKITPDNNIYAAVARGVKSGGFNGISPAIPFPAQQTYERETNWTYEVGSKNRFADIGLTLNVSAYYTDWKNLQSNAARLSATGTLPPPNSFATSVTGNIGSVKVVGAEIEGSFRPIREILFDFGASYNRSRYRKGVVSQRVGIAGNCNGVICSAANPLPIGGNNLERVPEFDALFGATFETVLSNDWRVFVRGDVTYQTKQYVDEINLAFVPDRTLVNAAAGVDIGNFSVNLWVKNLFDKKYVTSSLFLIGTNGGQSASYTTIFGDQRTAGVTGTFKF